MTRLTTEQIDTCVVLAVVAWARSGNVTLNNSLWDGRIAAEGANSLITEYEVLKQMARSISNLADQAWWDGATPTTRKAEMSLLARQAGWLNWHWWGE